MLKFMVVVLVMCLILEAMGFQMLATAVGFIGLSLVALVLLVAAVIVYRAVK